MSINTRIAFAVALIIGTASAALANDPTDERGGFPMPGSMDGVNPAYHPDIFGGAGKTFGYGAWSTQRDELSQSSKKSRSR